MMKINHLVHYTEHSTKGDVNFNTKLQNRIIFGHTLVSHFASSKAKFTYFFLGQ